jgi:hypothetical protein
MPWFSKMIVSTFVTRGVGADAAVIGWGVVADRLDVLPLGLTAADGVAVVRADGPEGFDAHAASASGRHTTADQRRRIFTAST